MIRPLRDYVWVRPRPELAEQTTTLKLTHGEMSDSERAIVSRVHTVGFLPLHHLAAVSADYRSHPDSLTFGEVLSVGPGRPELSQDRPMLRAGDLVSYKRNRIARDLPDPADPEKRLFMLHAGGIVLRHPDGAGGMPAPLADYVLTRVDPEGARKALGRQMPLTPEEVLWGVSARVHEQPAPHVCPHCKQRTSRNAAPGAVVDSRDRIMVERFVSSGPGRWVMAIWDERQFGARRKPIWVENFPEGYPIGQMLLFSSANDRARFRLHGEVFTISAWNDCIAVDDGNWMGGG